MAEYIDIDYPLLFKDIRNREIRVTVRDLLKANHAECVLADVAPVRHGRWVKTIGENGVTSACSCNLCGFEDNRYSLFNYCPNCGADMREPPKEET